MAKHKVSDLSGALLDAAVANALGWVVNGSWCNDPERPNDAILLGEGGYWTEVEHFAPSTRWQDGGPIIERERIVTVEHDGEWSAAICDGMDPGGDLILRDQHWTAGGATYLIAAMRSYVASKLGEEVELP